MLDRKKVSGNVGSHQTATFYTIKIDGDFTELEVPGILPDGFRIGGMLYAYSTTSKTGRLYFIDGVVGQPATFYAKKAFGV